MSHSSSNAQIYGSAGACRLHSFSLCPCAPRVLSHSWQCSRPGWMWLWETWSCGKCPGTWQGVGTMWSLRCIPSQITIWFHDYLKAVGLSDILRVVLLLFPRVTQLSKSIPAKHQGRRLFYHLSRNNIAYPAWQTVPWTCLEYPFLYLAHKDTTGENFSKRLMSQKEYILGPKSGEN